jgi:hypothetical protein
LHRCGLRRSGAPAGVSSASYVCPRGLLPRPRDRRLAARRDRVPVGSGWRPSCQVIRAGWPSSRRRSEPRVRTAC